MTELLVAAAGILVAAGLLFWTLAAQRRRRPDATRQQWIVTTLDAIKAEADRKRLHVNAEPKFDVAGAFQQLRDMTADYPTDTASRLGELERRWRELDSQYAEFNTGDPGSTLKSSVIAARTSKLADDIGALTDELRSSLD